MVRKIIAFVGMPGSGKSLATTFVRELNFEVLRLGDLTDRELKARSLPQNEANERLVREDLRAKFGMDIYAKKVAEDVDRMASSVILDGVRSFEEYLFLKKKYGQDFAVIALISPPKIRYERLMTRDIRPLDLPTCESRDMAELENLNEGNTIAMADYYVLNDTNDKDKFKATVNEVIGRIVRTV